MDATTQLGILQGVDSNAVRRRPRVRLHVGGWVVPGLQPRSEGNGSARIPQDHHDGTVHRASSRYFRVRKFPRRKGHEPDASHMGEGNFRLVDRMGENGTPQMGQKGWRKRARAVRAIRTNSNPVGNVDFTGMETRDARGISNVAALRLLRDGHVHNRRCRRQDVGDFTPQTQIVPHAAQGAAATSLRSYGYLEGGKVHDGRRSDSMLGSRGRHVSPYFSYTYPT